MCRHCPTVEEEHCEKQGWIEASIAVPDTKDSDFIRKREPIIKILKLWTLNCFMRAVVMGSTEHNFGWSMLIQNLERRGVDDLFHKRK